MDIEKYVIVCGVRIGIISILVLSMLSCLERSNKSTSDLDTDSDKLEDIRVDGAVMEEYAFDRLTPLGKKIFVEARRYLETQKHSDYQRYAQPLQCMVNVSYVLNKTGMNLPQHTRYSVPNMLSYIKEQGGKLYTLPTYSGDISVILDDIQKHFDGKLPTGALVAGCTVKNCQTSEFADAHIAILGDKNHRGEIMLYHNNWYRPNANKGKRDHYMVSLSSFYDQQRPREWMPTPWIRLIVDKQKDTEQDTKKGKNTLKDFKSIMPKIDDLDPLNAKYFITIAVFSQMLQELSEGKELKHHIQIIDDNIHKTMLQQHPDRLREVCRSKSSIKDIGIYRSPSGDKHHELIRDLSRFSGYYTPYNSRFEFVVRESSDDWYAIQFYAGQKYYGWKSKIWFPAEHAECKRVKDWLP